MTDTTAMRDELARSRGYGKSTSTVWLGPDGTAGPHPFKDGDLNALAAVIPEGVGVCIMQVGGKWTASIGGGHGGFLRFDSMYDALLPSVLAVLKAGEVGDA